MRRITDFGLKLREKHRIAFGTSVNILIQIQKALFTPNFKKFSTPGGTGYIEVTLRAENFYTYTVGHVGKSDGAGFFNFCFNFFYFGLKSAFGICFRIFTEIPKAI